MLSNTIWLFGGFVAPVLAGCVGVIWIRPAIARAQVEREALRIRDGLVLGILDGDIDRDNSRAIDVIRFCEFVADHSREITLTAAMVTERVLEKAGIDCASEVADNRAKAFANSAGKANETGQLRIAKAERDLDQAMSTYYIRGSAFWWFLNPAERALRGVWSTSARWFARAINRTDPVQDHRDAREAFPEDLVSEIREASRGADEPPRWWTAGPKRSRSPLVHH